jgi:Putative adhesin
MNEGRLQRGKCCAFVRNENNWHMKTATMVLRLAAVLVVSAACAALASTEETINKRLAVQPGGTLTVDVDFGSIDVTTADGNDVVVDAWRKVTRGKKADEESYLRDNPINVVQEGANVTVRSKSKQRFSWGMRNRNEGKYTICVPAHYSAKLGTAGGGISVTGLSGEVTANTSGGGLKFAHLTGPLKGATSGGGIHVDQCEGALRINTSGGPIEVAGGGGSLDGETSGGGVSVKDFRGPARVGTSGGGIRVERVSGEISGSTSGGAIHAELVSRVEAPVKLETSGGGVTVLVSGDAGFELDAETSGGSVSSDLPVTVTGKLDHHRLKGPVNGGGKSVFLRSSGGSIHIKKL